MITLALILAAFIVMSLGMDKHHRVFFDGGLSKPKRSALKGCAWLILCFAFVVCCKIHGPQFGPVWFAGIATVAAFMTMGLVSLRTTISKKAR
ncbi:DUF3325 domain-containing protein [Croceicoccus gelatinilyticus]|uniref:DUF3325 domain-containing protein n=1 Tax=Croceicoccus gelatinilyticus TaxID=2835536 RepID=UPI001BD0DB2A|nr:DUF3325 domain-containing protein [Croceicoccus gelatinilyticus]MBS7668704.1 DUF3325 domain-containing protein [Croceicoccus gelatinilyticus]